MMYGPDLEARYQLKELADPRLYRMGISPELELEPGQVGMFGRGMLVAGSLLIFLGLKIQERYQVSEQNWHAH
jgi:hypothetical protein